MDTQMKQSGFGVASLILGILGILLTCVVIGIVPSILGLIFAIVALRQKNVKRGMGIAGLVCSIVGVIFFLCLVILIGSDEESNAGDSQRVESTENQQNQASVPIQEDTNNTSHVGDVEGEDSDKDPADTESVVDNIANEDSDEVFADILADYLSNMSADEESSATNDYHLGDSVELITFTGGQIEVTLTDWGTYYESLTDEILLYVEYEIVNTGEITVSVGNHMFDIYADNYAVSQAYLLPDVVGSENISPNRNIRGKIYGEVNPSSVKKIEVEIGDVAFLINDKSGVTFPILFRGYADDSPCPVMVNDEVNDELWCGTVEDMLYSCINDGVTMYATPNMYGGDIYSPTRWDAPEDEWYSGLLTYEQFVGIVNWMEVAYMESGIENIYTFTSRENVVPLDGEWNNDDYEISISISSDWSYGYSYDQIGSCEIDGKEGQVLLIGSSDDSVFVFCVTSNNSWVVIGCMNDGTVYISDFS